MTEMRGAVSPVTLGASGASLEGRRPGYRIFPFVPAKAGTQRLANRTGFPLSRE